MKWYQISLLLCFFGLLKEIRPSEPYVSDYLQRPYRNITSDELNRFIYPIATYSNIILSVVVLLVTDLLRYKPIIVLEGLCGIITWSLLLWTNSFVGAQLVEVFYAFYANCEVAYFAYIYAKVSKDHFLEVSSHTRAALLVGRFSSGVLSQTLLYFKLMDVRTLNYLTFAAQIAATIVALLLPKVNESIYFYRGERSPRSIDDNAEPKVIHKDSHFIDCGMYQRAFSLMWKQLKCAYTNRRVILWSIWYACGFCMYVQFIAYVQLVWIEIDNRPEVMWNGAVDAVTTILSVAVALLASRVHTNFINTQLKVMAALFGMSLCASGSILLTANVSNRFLSYGGYLLFYVFYTFTITISSAEIAKELPEDSYGFVFGVNTFFAYCLQSILTAIVVSDAFNLHLDIFQQMNVYGGVLAFVGLIYLVLLVISSIRSKR